MSVRGEGKAIQWIRDHANYPHDDYCLIWPFSTIRGYGNFGYLGEAYYSHAYMCELVHGPAPSPAHQPAHSCGNGHEGCTNPRHLSWKTPSENQMDKQQHGTAHQVGRQRYKLKPEDVAYIRSMKGRRPTTILPASSVSAGAISERFRMEDPGDLSANSSFLCPLTMIGFANYTLTVLIGQRSAEK